MEVHNMISMEIAFLKNQNIKRALQRRPLATADLQSQNFPPSLRLCQDTKVQLILTLLVIVRERPSRTFDLPLVKAGHHPLQLQVAEFIRVRGRSLQH
jgi:hypothetical protein